jgi:hypothetical protein
MYIYTKVPYYRLSEVQPLKLEKPDELFKLCATVYKLNNDILPALLYLPFITS